MLKMCRSFPNLLLLEKNFLKKLKFLNFELKMSFGVSVLYVCMNKDVFALGARLEYRFHSPTGIQ